MEAYRRIRQAIALEFETHGLAIGQWDVTVTAKANGTTIVRRKRHQSEGSTIGIEEVFQDAASPQTDAARFTRTLSRLKRRDAAIAATGNFPPTSPPPWAQIADRTVTTLVERLDGTVDHIGRWVSSSNQSRGWRTRLNATSFRSAGIMGASGFALRTRAHVDTLSYNGLFWLSDGNGTPVITITRTIPATIAVAAAGRALDDIVDHPLLNGLGAVIQDIEQRDQLALIRIEPRLVAMADPPMGVDTSWLMPIENEVPA